MSAKTEQKYIEGIGRRKTAIARVRITPSSKESVSINDKTVEQHFKTSSAKQIVFAAMRDIVLDQKFAITGKIIGGGITSQAEAFRLGLARALVEFKSDLRGDLKKLGYLKRDPRVKERKKFGLKKARKAPQWSKR